MNWNETYHAGDTWDQDRDIALVGYVKYDDDYTAVTWPNTTQHLESGMPVYAVLNMDRSDGSAPGFDIWAQDFDANFMWVESADGTDLLEYYSAWFEWTEDIMDEIYDRHFNGDFD